MRGEEPPRRYCDICPLRKRSLLPTLSPMTSHPVSSTPRSLLRLKQKPWFVVSLSNHRPLSESVGKWGGNVGYETPKHE